MAQQTPGQPARHQNAADEDVSRQDDAQDRADNGTKWDRRASDEATSEFDKDQATLDVQAELAECQDRWLRMQAEMENLRRRTTREIADERRYAVLPFVRDLLEVLDNVDRAVEAGEKTPDANSLLEGFRLVGRQLRSVLEKHEVKPIAAEGELFDPNLHEAILQQPSEQPKGTVVLVTQDGYQLHERVVRPSQVIVSAGASQGDKDGGLRR